MDPEGLFQAVGALIIIGVFVALIYPALTAATGQEVPFIGISVFLLIIAAFIAIAASLRR